MFISWQLTSCGQIKQKKSREYKSDNESPLADHPGDLKKFLADFEKAALSHSEEKLMQTMDHHYKAEQHDQFLQGRTEQFLNEFFCGNKTDGKEEFICLKYSEITAIKLKDITKNESGYNVDYIVSGNSFSIKCSWTITVNTAGDILVYGLCGAVG
jgi:hypothetical protein